MAAKFKTCNSSTSLAYGYNTELQPPTTEVPLKPLCKMKDCNYTYRQVSLYKLWTFTTPCVCILHGSCK